MGAVPVRRTGTALTRSASAAGAMLAKCCDDAMAASCSRPIATGDRFAALRKNVESDCFARGAARRAARSACVRSGRKSMCRIASPVLAIASRSDADSA